MVTNNKMPRYLRPNVTIQYPNSAERDYYRVLRAVVRELRKYTNELLPSIKPSLKQDADSEDIINEVTARFNNSRVREAALNEVQRIISSVDNIARQNMNKAFKNCLGVDVFMSNTALLDKITSEWYASQSQLINSIVSTYTDKLGTIISNAVQRGSLYKDVYADVKHLYDITDNRAKFIARNEIGNLNAITTKTRQQEAGVNCYEWLTSRDERVRASHAAMDGNLYYWSRSTPGEINGRKVYPTPGLQPGMDYNCRCVAIPIIDTESWNVANATPDGQPVANRATEVGNEQFYKSIKDVDTEKTLTTTFKGTDITASEIKGLGGMFYSSAKANMKRKQFHIMRQWLNESKKRLGISRASNQPYIIIVSPEEIDGAAAVYKYAENAILIADFMGDSKAILDAMGSRPASKDIHSIFIHELLHWMDGERFRKKYGGNTEEYLKWIIQESQKEVEKLLKSGYDIQKISEYASESWLKSRLDEIYAEYRTKQILEKGGK